MLFLCNYLIYASIKMVVSSTSMMMTVVIIMNGSHVYMIVCMVMNEYNNVTVVMNVHLC